MSGEKYYSQIRMLVDPTQSTHVVTLKYLIDYVSGKIKDPVRVVASANLEADYDATAMTLTGSYAEALPEIDGVDLHVGDRILVARQDNAAHNGIYVVTDLGSGSAPWVLTRADDFNQPGLILAQVKIPVSEGTQDGDTIWIFTTDETPIVLGTTELNFIRAAGLLPDLVKSRVFTIEGDGVETSWDLEHGLGTRDLMHEVFDAAGETVRMGFQRVDANTLQVTTGVPLAADTSYTVVVIAA